MRRFFSAISKVSIPNKSIPKAPPLPEHEIEEKFIRGTGPGGQKINKSSIVAQLRHMPTGLKVNCQETRSREENRTIGRKILAEKVDFHRNGTHSRLGIMHSRSQKRERNRRKKARKKYGPKDDVNAKDDVDGSEPRDDNPGTHG